MLRLAAPFWFDTPGTHSILATGPAEGPYAASLREAGYAVFHIPFCKKAAYFRQVLSVIRSGDYDVVHIHTEQAHAFYGICARLARVERLVYTIHNTYAFTGCLRIVRLAMRRVLALLGATAVAVGSSVAQNERQRFGNRTLTIWNWFDTEIFRPPSAEERQKARQQYGITDDRTVIVTLGNCNAWKNHSLLIRAIRLLIDRNKNWCYLHAGEEDWEKSEQKLVADLGLGQTCLFLGTVNPSRSVLWAGDVFVMPSIREGFSIAAIEAAGCGLPLVLSDVPGLRDLKEAISDGYWVNLTPEAFANAIEAAVKLYPNRSTANGDSARKAFSIAAGASAYLGLYCGLGQRG